VVLPEPEALVDRERTGVVAPHLEVRRGRTAFRAPGEQGVHHRAAQPLPPVVGGHPDVGDPDPPVRQVGRTCDPALGDDAVPGEGGREGHLRRALEDRPRRLRVQARARVVRQPGCVERRRQPHRSGRCRQRSAYLTDGARHGADQEPGVGLPRPCGQPPGLLERRVLRRLGDDLRPGRQRAFGIELSHPLQGRVLAQSGVADREHRVGSGAEAAGRPEQPARPGPGDQGKPLDGGPGGQGTALDLEGGQPQME
jgi:hypothetical protein